MFTRNQLLLVVVTLALLIGLFSNPDRQHERKTPWNIQRLPDGRIHVFGLTPGKTSIQEANQILGHFADTRLYNTEPARLLATHEKLILGEEPARLDLQYQLDELDVAELQQASTVFSPCRYIKPAIEQEITLLNMPIEKIIYTPVNNYSVGQIESHLGDPDELRVVNETQQIMLYQKYNLTVHINSDKADVFVYAAAMPVSDAPKSETRSDQETTEPAATIRN